MLTLYYAPGACSMASHIALEETGAPYQTQIVGLAQGEQTKPEYLNGVNPRGKVPALKTDDGILTENVAILTYLARTFPDAKLLPTDPLGTARALSYMAYLSNTVHPAFTHIMRPGRFATDESAHENLKATGKENFWKLLQEIDGLLEGKGYVLGSHAGVLRLGQAHRIAGRAAEELHRAEGPAAAAPGGQESAPTGAERVAEGLKISPQPRQKPGPTFRPLGKLASGSRLSPGLR